MVYNHQNRRHHHHHHGGGGRQNIPRGHVAVTVGPEHQRFVIPVMYVNHPLFTNLLKAAEEEYGFNYKEGPIDIPCHVDEFCEVRGLIDNETMSHHHHHHHPDVSICNNNYLHHHHHQFLCFKA